MYAERTSVSVGRTKGEIEDLLNRHKATAIYSGQQVGRAIVGFEMNARRVQFELALPALSDFETRVDGRSHQTVRRTPEAQLREWEQACRERWRALLLCIKAKLVSSEAGVETFEEAFLAQIVVPGRGRVGDAIIPQLSESYRTGKMPPLLPSHGGRQ